MSQESVKEFYQVLENDPELQELVKAADSSANIVQIAANKGYEFTAEELEITMQEAIAEGELKEEELELIAGGDKTKTKCKRGYTQPVQSEK